MKLLANFFLEELIFPDVKCFTPMCIDNLQRHIKKHVLWSVVLYVYSFVWRFVWWFIL